MPGRDGEQRPQSTQTDSSRSLGVDRTQGRTLGDGIAKAGSEIAIALVLVGVAIAVSQCFAAGVSN